LLFQTSVTGVIYKTVEKL